MSLTADLVALAEMDGRYGSRKIDALPKAAGWPVNDKRVERIWWSEGPEAPLACSSLARTGDLPAMTRSRRPGQSLNHAQHPWAGHGKPA